MNDEQKYFHELKNIEKKYYNIISHFNLAFPKAINYKIEKRKFFTAIADDKIYNPKFKFNKIVINDEKFDELKKLKIDTKNDLYGFKRLYKKRLKTKIFEIEARKRWGKPSSTNYIIKYRGKPSILLLSRAKNFCRKYRREKVKFKTLTPEIAAKRLQKEAKKLTGVNLRVIYANIISKVNILGNVLKINPNIRFTSLDVKRLKAHEIGVHFLRYYNGSLSDIKILESGTSNYLETEEGLAVYAEKIRGVLSSAQMFIYAGRVIATYYVLKKNFYDVFMILKSYGFSDEDAFMITYRAKRNICDTTQKGGFTKDYVYFSGYFKVRKYARHNDVKDLFIGKIKIEDLKVLRKYIKKNKDRIISIF